MRVNGIKKLIVMARIIITTITEASLLTLGFLFDKGNRKCMDKRIGIWNRNMLEIVKTKFHVSDPGHFTFQNDRVYVVMSNHLSLYDIPLIFATFPGASVRMIAKKELFRIPIFGWGIKAGECVSIDRNNHRQALRDLETAKQKMLSGIKIWIAPEGSRSRTGKMGLFKKGGFKLAMNAKAIIVPVAIIGSDRILRAGTFDFSVDESIQMHICQPVDTNNYSLQELPKLMQVVRDQIQAHLKD
jgi:1-acyl-sn-glycerol-3-phosphate acyltransferase